jgi:hypothetical protein
MNENNRHIDLSEETEFTQEQPFTDIQANTETAGKAGPKQKPENGNSRVGVREIISGSFLVRENMIKQLPYLLFLTFLGIVYIGNRFHAERMVRQIEELKIEVGNLRSEQITITSELMNISRPSQVAALVESRGLGLKESMEPPKKLKK